MSTTSESRTANDRAEGLDNRTVRLPGRKSQTGAGRQRSSLNACRHKVTGAHLLLRPEEMAAYNRLTAGLLSDLKPYTEIERQTAQKIIDTHFRLNRLAGIENNIFGFGTVAHSTATPHDDRVEVMIAQTRAWLERAGSFDILGRYEARLARQLLQYTRELERLQRARGQRVPIDSPVEGAAEGDDVELGSFGGTAPGLVMRAAKPAQAEMPL
jgi:hypothetical protein